MRPNVARDLLRRTVVVFLTLSWITCYWVNVHRDSLSF